MNIMKWRSSAMLGIAGALMLSNSAWATPVGTGTFNLTGTAVGSTTGVTFNLLLPDDQKAIAVQPLLGQFAGLAPASVQTIRDLTVANGVIPGTSFNFTNWIQLTDGINLDATSLPIPAGFSPCTSAAEPNGFQCLVAAGSPVILTQTASGVSARFNIFGNAHFVGDPQLTPFVGLLNAPSTNFATIADFEAFFNANGAIPPVSYAGSFTTSMIPEPASLAIVALGLIGCGFYRRSKKAAQ